MKPAEVEAEDPVDDRQSCDRDRAAHIGDHTHPALADMVDQPAADQGRRDGGHRRDRRHQTRDGRVAGPAQHQPGQHDPDRRRPEQRERFRRHEERQSDLGWARRSSYPRLSKPDVTSRSSPDKWEYAPTLASMTARWVIVLVTTAVLVAVPLAVRHRPATDSDISAIELAERIQASGGSPGPGWPRPRVGSNCPTATPSSAWPNSSARTTSSGSGGAAADDWRIDRVRSTGETDLFRQRSDDGALGVRVRDRDDHPGLARFGCRMPPTCCRRPWRARCSRAYARDELTRIPGTPDRRYRGRQVCG